MTETKAQDRSVDQQHQRDEADSIGSPADRAIFLALLLRRRGIPLGASWRDALPGLSVRTYNVLVEMGFQTLAEVLRALRNDGQEIMSRKNFGRKSLDDLWEAIGQLAGPGITGYQFSLFESSELTEEFLLNVEAESPWIEPSLSAYMLARLEAAGVDPDQSWHDALPVVSTRLRAVLNDRFVTLREVVIAATDKPDSLRQAENFGRKSLRELWELLEKLAEHGADYVRYGNQGAPPATVDELVARALQSLSDKDGRLLIRRFLDGAKLEDLGREYDVTRERIRQKVNQILLTLRRRMGADAKGLTGSLVEAAEQSGGLLHREAALRRAEASDWRRVLLALMIAGADAFHIWRKEFLTSLKPDELSGRLTAIRHCFREHRKHDLSLTEAGELIAEASGFRLGAAGVTGLLIYLFDCRITEDKQVIFGSLKISDRLEKILRAANRPLHISEIADLYLASSITAGAEAIADLGDDEDEDVRANLRSSGLGRRERTERALVSAISRGKDIYQCGPKTFVHANALPIPIEKLDEAVDFCVSRIEGEPGAFSAEFLLKILRAAGFDSPGLNKFLLKDALSRRPEIVSLRMLRVGHAASFQEHELKLTDRIEAILRETDCPLAPIEILQRLPRNTNYVASSVAMCLRDATFAVNLGQKYIHVQSLGLTEDQCFRLVEVAVDLLPRDGSPISCATILKNLRSRLPEFGLADREDAANVLRGLMRLKADVLWDAGSLVARRVEGKG
ncbi:MAG: DNA-directed RNA polymerase subunit alpha C-terminal domain-containing protein [Blastocatellia bacterium]